MLEMFLTTYMNIYIGEVAFIRVGGELKQIERITHIRNGKWSVKLVGEETPVIAENQTTIYLTK